MGLLSGAVIRAARRGWDSSAPVPESERPSTNELILVVSPTAARSAKLEQAKKAIKAIGLQVIEEIPVKDAALVPRLLQRQGSSPMVVAAGGDGTVGGVADAIVGSPAGLGILPLAPPDDLARPIRVPSHGARAVRLLARGRISRVDAGRFTGEG